MEKYVHLITKKHQKNYTIFFFDEKTYLVELVDDVVYGSLQVNR